MGHHATSKSSIVPLIDRLNKYPIGLVDNEKLRRILAILFSEEEAFVASRFPLHEATLEELARLTGCPPEHLEKVLDRMADKGLVLDMPHRGTIYYLLLPGLIGFFEFSFMKQRADLPLAELARLMSDYLFEDPQHGQAREFFGSRTPLTRSLAYEETVPVSSTVTSYEGAREIIRKAGYGAVGMCYCRHKKEHLDEHCSKGAPVEGICISLGNAARFMVRRGFAEERSVEELLAVIDNARKHNLTHITDNIRRQPSFICNCCSCCCELLAGVQAGYRDGIGKTGLLVTVDVQGCVGCGLCVGACNVAALKIVNTGVEKQRKLEIAGSVCLGCGACVSACPHQALSMVATAEPVIPARKRDLMKQILREKKRLAPFVVDGVKRKVKKIVTRK
ncbi:4Fe-4S dicluster domain-containing protein [Geothermobacter hydrogeniphilus]|uniref:4Fe-4S ferredoxin n=1 Tax=Geothermobacter hydrogeniphilus TaxID=1969733 RepID=A0A1X0Y652_9BACT|nr:4Fe-4S dicluster domain-containing protein [Geothermobacter hydrogeniphilus]ORJ60681.1 4Fe-4S ferredoxin [Geothermobacter hydrogeniphilus]